MSNSNLLERRRHLVLDHLDAGLVADDLLAILDRADAANVETDGGVELERVAARRGLGRAVHHADLHADLVDEDHHGLRARDRGGELAQGLAHQPGLEARLIVAHLAVDLGPRRQRRHRIDDEHVDGAGAHQRVGDLERLLAGVRLRDEQILEIHPELPRVDRIERVLGIDEGADAALLLRLGDHVEPSAWSCPRIPARRSRPRVPSAGRRLPARCRGRANPSGSSRSRAPAGSCPAA